MDYNYLHAMRRLFHVPIWAWLLLAAGGADFAVPNVNAAGTPATAETSANSSIQPVRRLDLLRSLGAINQKYRTRAIHELGKANLNDDEVLAALVKYALEVDDFRVGPVIPILASKGTKIVPFVVGALRQTSLSRSARTALMCSLGRMGPDAKAVINDLRSLLADPQQTEESRLLTRVALATIGWEDKENQSWLLENLLTRTNTHPSVAAILTSTGAGYWPGEILLDRLAPSFNGRPSEESAFAATALATLGTNAAPAASQIQQCLDNVDQNWSTLRILYGTSLARLHTPGSAAQKQAYRQMLKYLGRADNHTDWAALFLVAHSLVDTNLAEQTIDLLDDSEALVSQGAVRMLTELATPSSRASRGLMTVLLKSKPGSRFRTEAASCLGFVLPYFEIGLLEQAIASEPDQNLAGELRSSPDIVSLGKKVNQQSTDAALANATDADWPAIFRALLSPNTDFQASQAIRRQGTNAISHLITALNEDDLSVRVGAAKGFSYLMLYAVPLSREQELACSQTLTNALSSSTSSVRKAVADTLVYFGIHRLCPEHILPALLASLGDAEVRAPAARAIGFYRSEARQAVSALAALLVDPSAPVRKSAAESLGEIGPDARECVDALLRAFSADKALRPAVAHALGRIGGRAQDVIPVLLKELGKDDDKYSVTSSSCALTIASYGTNAWPHLQPLLESRQPGERYWATVATARLRPVIPATLAAVENAAGDPDPEVRTLAQRVIQQMRQDLK